MSKLYGLIPAAGKGTRARPYTSAVPKSMLDVNGVPNLQRIISLMRDQLGIHDVVIITGYLGDYIEEYFEKNRPSGVELSFIRNTDLDKGLAWSVLLGREIIDDYFCVILSDECYIASNHRDLTALPFRDAFGVCAVKEVDDTALIHKNYAVEIDEEKITRLIEKPKQVKNDILGCGTFIFSPVIFQRLQTAFDQASNDYVEFVSFLDDQRRDGERILPFRLTGSYVNINDRDSLHTAKYHDRNNLFPSRTKALIVYSEGVEKNVLFTIQRYSKLDCLDSIHLIVPYENSIEDAVREHDIDVIRCPPGIDLYGEKLKFAMDRVTSDILILTEADYAFPSRDIEKLLVYLKEADMVLGTRTTRQLMEQGSDLEGPVRLTNVFLAKIMELLWWHFEGRFTDVGCTFRAIWRSAYYQIRDQLQAPGPEFSAEMIVEALNRRMRIIEIPVNYYNVSRSMSERYRNVNTFFRFLFLLLKKRVKKN